MKKIHTDNDLENIEKYEKKNIHENGRKNVSPVLIEFNIHPNDIFFTLIRSIFLFK